MADRLVLVATYIKDFLVSTAYRRSSAAVDVEVWYYETLIFRLGEKQELIGNYDSGSFPAQALTFHCNKVHDCYNGEYEFD